MPLVMNSFQESLLSEGKNKLLNGNREFVELKPDMLSGDIAGALFDPDKGETQISWFQH